VCSDVTDTVLARTPSPAQLLPAPSMMLPISLAVLSLVFPARAEVPALYTGTWRSTGMPRGEYHESTQNANGSYTGKGWGTWSDDLTSGTNNYTVSGITSDAVCETDATTGAVSLRYKYTSIQDWDLGANPMPSWSTASGQKRVFCGYGTYDATTDIMTVTDYEGSETFALSDDPGACPTTAQEAATGLSWSAVTTESSYTLECVADCNPWACDATDLVGSTITSGADASATQTNSIEFFASTDGTCTGTRGDLSDNSLFRWAASSGSCSSYDSWSPPPPSTWPVKAKYLQFTCSATDVTFYQLCSEGCATSTCVDTITVPKSKVIGTCMDQATAEYPDYKIHDFVGCDDYDDYSGAGTLSYLATGLACAVTALLLLV